MRKKIFSNFLVITTILPCFLFLHARPIAAQEIQLKVLAPNGGEKFAIGSNVEIQWSAKNFLGVINILLEKNNIIIGEIANDINVSSGKFSWKAGMVKIGLAGPSDTYKILIRTVDSKSQDESDSSFSILATALPPKAVVPTSDPSRLVIAKPDANTRWCLETQNVIQWTGSLPASTSFKIELLQSSGSLIKVIVNNTPNSGSYQWDINPAQYNFNEGVFRIRIIAVDGSIAAESANFRIGKELSLSSPRGNPGWRKGSSYRIEWLNECNIPSNAVKIDLLNANKHSVLPIAAYVALNKNYNWTVPANLTPGAYYIRVMTTEGIFSAEGPITIEEALPAPAPTPTPKPSIAITQPSSNTQWCIGQEYLIQWGSNLPADAKLKIELLATDNAPKELIAGSVLNSGSYVFNIQQQQYNFNRRICRLRVSTQEEGVFFETPDFIIGKPLFINTPKNNDAWHKGNSYNISWTVGCSSTAKTVKIELFDERHNMILNIAPEQPINQAYNWSIPADLISGTYTLKINTLDNQLTAEESLNIIDPL
jgi:hypothetical protein